MVIRFPNGIMQLGGLHLDCKRKHFLLVSSLKFLGIAQNCIIRSYWKLFFNGRGIMCSLVMDRHSTNCLVSHSLLHHISVEFWYVDCKVLP